MWLDHLQKSDLTKQQLSVIMERMSYDRTTPLQTQLDWLTEAGFEDVDCYYKYYNFAVYAGRKLRGISNGC
jgi:tRNA (cmo5U34)-methyltransferase